MIAAYAPAIEPSEVPQPGEDPKAGLALRRAGDPIGPLGHKNPHVVRILEAFWAHLAKTTRDANRANVASSEKLGGAPHAP